MLSIKSSSNKTISKREGNIFNRFSALIKVKMASITAIRRERSIRIISSLTATIVLTTPTDTTAIPRT